jgi:hypothetical protein
MLVPCDWKSIPWVFFQLNDDDHVTLGTKQFFLCILYHSIILVAHVLRSKTQDEKD